MKRFRDFEGGEHFTPANPMTEDAWTFPELEIDELRVHPKHLIEETDLVLWGAFMAWRGGGFAAGPLPEAGGYLDQAAATMASFEIFAAALARLEKKGGTNGAIAKH